MKIEEVLDKTLLTHLETHPDLHDKWLLMQNVALAQLRRSLLDILGLKAGESVLDLGCGFGALALDVAALHQVNVIAVDADEEKLVSAKEMRDDVQGQLNSVQCQVSFSHMNAYQLQCEDETFDWVISQHVFQHLSHPLKALEEVSRVLKPGGRVCLIDVDGGLGTSYPEHTTLKQLSALLEEVQRNRGGDREIGRKLPHLLHQSGFEVTLVRPIVQAAFISNEDRALMRTVMAQHFADIRGDAVQMGVIRYEAFDALLNAFMHDPVPYTFYMDTQFMVTGQKR